MQTVDMWNSFVCSNGSESQNLLLALESLGGTSLVVLLIGKPLKTVLCKHIGRD